MLTTEACECLSSMLVPETMWKSMIHVVTDCKEQGSYFCSSIDDCKLTVEKEEHKRLL